MAYITTAQHDQVTKVCALSFSAAGLESFSLSYAQATGMVTLAERDDPAAFSGPELREALRIVEDWLRLSWRSVGKNNGVSEAPEIKKFKKQPDEDWVMALRYKTGNKKLEVIWHAGVYTMQPRPEIVMSCGDLLALLATYRVLMMYIGDMLP